MFDLDNTLCYTKGIDYEQAKPIRERIRKVNALYDKSHTIKIFTGRGSRSGINWRDLTLFQLKEWGVKYHELIMGKPVYDLFIDDSSCNVNDWVNDNLPYTTTL